MNNKVAKNEDHYFHEIIHKRSPRSPEQCRSDERLISILGSGGEGPPITWLDGGE